jgi:Ribonucleotide reductase inhibitor
MTSSAAKPTASNSSKRRRFQPPITRFFASSGTVSEGKNSQDDAPSHDNYSSSTYSPTPSLSPKVQASLLTVGMRIRKSVAEGYKTEPSKLTGYAIAKSVESLREAPRTGPSSYTRTTASYAELEPFCGIHKTGNLAIQMLPREGVRFSSDEDDVFCYEPGSNLERDVLSAPAINPHKRAYDSDPEEWDDDGITSLDMAIEPSIMSEMTRLHGTRQSLVTHEIWRDAVHPSIATRRPPAASVATVLSSRAILSPNVEQQRRRLYKSLSGQENCHPSNDQNTMDLDDFEEAAFLRQREEIDCECFASGVEVIMADDAIDQ